MRTDEPLSVEDFKKLREHEQDVYDELDNGDVMLCYMLRALAFACVVSIGGTLWWYIAS